MQCMANNPLRFLSCLFCATFTIAHEAKKGNMECVKTLSLASHSLCLSGSPSLLITVCLCENEIAAAVLAFWNAPRLWMGRSPAAWTREREREIQFKVSTAHWRTLILCERLCVCVCAREGGSWPALQSHQIRLWHHIYGAFLQSRFSRGASNVEALFLGCRNPSLLLADTWCIPTQTHTLFYEGPERRRPGLWWNR